MSPATKKCHTTVKYQDKVDKKLWSTARGILLYFDERCGNIKLKYQAVEWSKVATTYVAHQHCIGLNNLQQNTIDDRYNKTNSRINYR